MGRPKTENARKVVLTLPEEELPEPELKELQQRSKPMKDGEKTLL